MSKFTNLQELFSDPKRWTQGASAKDNRGRDVPIQDHTAVCWCLAGGIGLIYPKKSGEILVKIRSRLWGKGLGVGVSFWNDCKDRTIEDVRELVRELNI